MSLTLNRPAHTALMVMMIASTTLVAAPVNASGRDAAPIRIGNVTQTASYNKGRGEAIQLAYSAPAASRTTSGSLFAYPDEPLPVYGKSAKSYSAAPVHIASNNRAAHGLPYVDPVEYASYVKIGKPYKKFGKKYKPEADPFYNETGVASWYGPGFHGKLTANGEDYDMHALTAAHPTLPLPSFVEVTNLENGRRLVVRVNDRGPFAKDRVIDLSREAANRLDMIRNGSAKVRVKYLAPAPKAEPETRPFERPDTLIAEAPRQTTRPVKLASLPSHFVQLGSFRDRQNAEGLLNTVKSYSSDAGLVYANVNGSNYYRVVLGPFDTRNQAEHERSSIAGRGFDGIVILNR